MAESEFILLSATYSQRNTKVLDITQCSAEELVKQAFDTMMPVAQEANVKLTMTGVDERPGCLPFFEGDADKTLQVLTNLISSALGRLRKTMLVA